MATATALRVTGGVLKQELEELFREHWQLVYRTAFSVLRNRQDAEDVLQNLFLKLFERELPLDLTNNPPSYLYRAAVNASLNLVRSRKNEILTDDFHSQAAGRHLHVQTRDLKVSVVGTVFLVKADDKGSRVAVVEGEVHVQQGTVEKSLRPGEQLASNPKSPALDTDRKFFRETGWSREAYAYLSKLHESMAQSLAARQAQGPGTSISDKPQFEEASIRPCEKDFPAAEGRGGGGNGSIRISPGRVDVSCMTVPTLITMAHPFRILANKYNLRRSLPITSTFGSFPQEDGTHVRGGPDWVRSDKYTIEAVGDSTDASTLQGPMLLDLLERRFKLKLRIETDEISVYALTIAKGGLKIKPFESVEYEELRKVRAQPTPGRVYRGGRGRFWTPRTPACWVVLPYHRVPSTRL